MCHCLWPERYKRRHLGPIHPFSDTGMALHVMLFQCGCMQEAFIWPVPLSAAWQWLA